MQRTWRTPKGTELPISKIKGKEYLEVKWRILWMREEHPDWSIVTELIHRDANSAVVKAQVISATGQIMAEGHKFEDAKGFPDFIEKAETGAIGRALALCGYGTQFCGEEFDEGERLADSPVLSVTTTPIKGLSPAPSKPRDVTPKPNVQIANPALYKLPEGFRNLTGMQLKDIPEDSLRNVAVWCETEKEKAPPPKNLGDILQALGMIKQYLEGAK